MALICYDKNMLIKGVCLGLLGVGVFVLVQVMMPFLAYKTWEVFALDSNQLLTNPMVGSINYDDSEVLGVSVESMDNFPTFISHDPAKPAPYKQFVLSIPAVKLSNMPVDTNTNDFDWNLAQLPGTAFPGERGNVFVSGHSSVIGFQFGNLRALLVDLPKVKKGDHLLVEALGQRFDYVVQGLKVVDPKDVSVIKPPDSEGRYLTVMTCVPPGFNTKRLVVVGKIE